MITDIEYYEESKDREENLFEFNQSVDISINQYEAVDVNNREDKIFDLASKVQKYCRKACIPIFNRSDTIIILMNLFK